MKLLDLFSGIGGFSLGAEYNNIKTVGFVEKDAYCQKVLRKHWPDVPILEDIRNVKRDTFESVDIVSGGFPCQPFSVAGKQRGTDDDRYLWDETIRVVSLYKPRWFIGENVEGLVNIQNGVVLRQVQDDLEKEGFEVQCGIIPASGIGAWHQRKRVWIIAYSNSNRESRCSQYVQQGSRELGKSHVCDSQHNGSSTTKEQRGNTQTSTGSQKRENSSLQSERTSRPTDNGDVPKSNSNKCEYTSTRQSRDNKIWGFHTKEKEQASYDIRSETSGCDDVSGEQEDVSNPKSRTRQQTQWQGRESIGRGSDDRGRIEREGKNNETDVSNSCSERQLHRESGNLGEESRETQRTRENDTQGTENTSARGGQNVPHTNSEGLQGYGVSANVEGMQGSEDNSAQTSSKEQHSWWEIESKLCGVPNGVSYELDKGRVNRIKSLGNSIVPQIAYQLFKSICVAEEEK